LASEEKKSTTLEELSSKLDLIMKRLDTLEAIILGNPDYTELATSLRLVRASVSLYGERAFEKQLIKQGMAKDDAKRIGAQYAALKDNTENAFKQSFRSRR